jgi:hypothetical protein
MERLTATQELFSTLNTTVPGDIHPPAPLGTEALGAFADEVLPLQPEAEESPFTSVAQQAARTLPGITPQRTEVGELFAGIAVIPAIGDVAPTDALGLEALGAFADEVLPLQAVITEMPFSSYVQREGKAVLGNSALRSTEASELFAGMITAPSIGSVALIEALEPGMLDAFTADTLPDQQGDFRAYQNAAHNKLQAPFGSR